MRRVFGFAVASLISLATGCPSNTPPHIDDDAGTDDDAVEDDDTAPNEDRDGDGWTEALGDCDDADASVHPGAKEVVCDGKDNDCDGEGALGAMIGEVWYATLHDALETAADGETIAICPGVHTGQLYIDDARQLALTSHSGNRNDTILDGEGKSTVVFVGQENQIEISHLTIRNGLAEPWLSGDYAGGGLMSFALITHVHDCAFVDNRSPERGAAGAGLALFRHHEWSTDSADLTVEGCHFEGNTIDGKKSGSGAATYVSTHRVGVSVNLSDSTFMDNRAESMGGAVYVETNSAGDSDRNIRIERCTFENNEVGYAGGAVMLTNWGSLELSESAFVGNSSGYEGGALAALQQDQDASFIEVQNTSFLGNWASSQGGAWDITPSSHGNSVDLCLDSVEFANNVASEGGGGGIHVAGDGSSSITATETLFVGNTAFSGGGLEVSVDGGATFTMTGGSFSGNQGTYTSGACYFFSADETNVVTLHDVSIEGNDNPEDGAGVVSCSLNSECTLQGCEILANSGGGAWIARAQDNATLVSIGSDWGDGFPQDNSPFDVWVYEGEQYTMFGANEDFTCTGELGCI